MQFFSSSDVMPGSDMASSTHFCANYPAKSLQCPPPQYLGTTADPLDPGHTEHLVKKLVILKEVVCDQFKMKLNDMVSLIGQFKSIFAFSDVAC